ncbi:uncharacterized protein LOC122850542 [Aphidius gifuensis]|uniref:uncharacterized protein LOC122850542 n=1 Tax=Aphidius gifuensis TaxID=684658 RepID=UPI001CDC59AB|nr:uncharacterized protein LOC122850542 [Aphidius gifuensis]
MSTINNENETPTRKSSSDSQLHLNKTLQAIPNKLNKIQDDNEIFRNEILDELKNLSTRVDNINTTTQSAVKVSTKSSLIKKYYCDTIVKFDLFDENLRTDKQLNNKIRLSLIEFIDTTILVQSSIEEILKQVMTKEVLFNFTADKAMKEKLRVFVKTELWKCTEDTILAEWEKKNLPNFKDKELLKAIGLATNSSRDWLRKKNQQTEPTTIAEVIPDIGQTSNKDTDNDEQIENI